MAANQIPVSNTTPWGQALLQLRQQYLSFRQQQAALNTAGAAVLAKIAAMVNGNDYTQLESQLSLQAGQGVNLFNQLNSVVGNFADTTKTQAQVAAAVDQFDGWIG